MIDKGKLSILCSVKADHDKLLVAGDVASTISPTATKIKQEEKKCRFCCMAYGLLVSSVAVFFVTGAATAVAILTEKRVNYTLNGAMRQVGWLAIPGIITGTTMHFFLTEAMWSGKKNSWGQAWTKTMAVNAILWSGIIGGSTLFWRKGLPLTAAGRRVFYRYPIPTEQLETRVLRSSHEFCTGMGWSYWMSGVASGHLSLLPCVAFCVWNDRPYLMMAPYGGYSSRCLPPWRRDHLANLANVSRKSE